MLFYTTFYLFKKKNIAIPTIHNLEYKYETSFIVLYIKNNIHETIKYNKVWSFHQLSRAS